MRKITIAFMAALLIVAAVACSVRQQSGKTAATVDGVAIPEAAVKWGMRGHIAQHAAANVNESAMRTAVLNQYVANRLLAEGAKEKGLSVTDSDLKVHMDAESSSAGAEKFAQSLRDAGLTEKQYQDILRDRILASMFTQTLYNDASITDGMLRDVYMKLPKPMMMPETVTIRFMEFKDEASAARAAAKVKASGFDKVADAYKRDNAATVSGYGEIAPSFFDPEAAKAVSALAPGGWTGPVKGRSGFYLIRLKQHNPPRPKTFDEARGELRGMLATQLKNQSVMSWLAARKGSAKIVINSN